MNDWLSVAAVMSLVGLVVVVVKVACERWIERRADALFLQAKGTALDAVRSYGFETGKAERRCPACAGLVTVSECATGVPGALPVLEVRCECGLCDISFCLQALVDGEVE
jgi:hypothetical protein